MSECDIAEFITTKEVIAKKSHWCCECDSQIQKGEKYLVITGKWDEVMATFKQHLICASACEFIRDNIDGDCIPFGELKLWYGDNKPLSKELEILPFRNMLAQIFKRERMKRKKS